MLGAAVPEAAVEEHGEALPREGHVARSFCHADLALVAL